MTGTSNRRYFQKEEKGAHEVFHLEYFSFVNFVECKIKFKIAQKYT